MPFDSSIIHSLFEAVDFVSNRVLAPVELTKAVVASASFLTVSPKTRHRLEESRQTVVQATAEAAHAACIGLAVHLSGRAPTQELVDQIADVAHSGPGAPFRVYRLLGEVTKSTSERRRLFLASIFHGLPLTDMPIRDRDRVDLLVERLMPEDVSELKSIADLETRTAGPHHPGRTMANYPYWVAGETTHIYSQETGHKELEVAPVIFSSLMNYGCLADVRQQWGELSTGVPGEVGTRFFVTPLGRLLVRAFDDLRPAIEEAYALSRRT